MLVSHLIAGSFIDISKKLVKGRKYESEPNSPYASESSKLRSRVFSSEKVESENNSSSMSLSEEFNFFENTHLKKEKIQSPPLVPTTGILSKVPFSISKHSFNLLYCYYDCLFMGISLLQPENTNVNTKEVVDSPVTKASTNEGNAAMNHNSTEAGRTIDNKREGKTGSGSRSISLSILGIDINNSFEESDEEEVESDISDSSISVGKYSVKESSLSTLQMIFDRYGDIAANCQLESMAMRSYYLQSVCSVIQELQSISMKQLTKSKVKEILAILKDVESAGIDIGWLCSALAETAETIELMNQHRAFELAKANCEQDIESTRKQLESQVEELADLKKVVAETRAHLRELELKSSVLGENIGSIKSKVDKFQSKSVLDGVF